MKKDSEAYKETWNPNKVWQRLFGIHVGDTVRAKVTTFTLNAGGIGLCVIKKGDKGKVIEKRRSLFIVKFKDMSVFCTEDELELYLPKREKHGS